MSNIHYFPRYSQKENFITNNTLLLLYRLYNEDQRKFQKFLKHLLDETVDTQTDDIENIEDVDKIGLQIHQQSGTKESTLDGYLHQVPLHIGVETKRVAAEFYSDQLERHLSIFRKDVGGFQLLLSPSKVDLKRPEWTALRALARKKNVSLVSITFENVIHCFRQCLRDHDEELHILIDDFEDFCSGEALLDQDRHTVFVPPCGQSFDINRTFNLYFCPSNWTRRETKYIGIYKEKSIKYIGEIRKVVYVDSAENGVPTFLDKSGQPIDVDNEIEKRIRSAADVAMSTKGWDILHGHKFYLCDQLCITEFKKSTPNGIMGHRYLYLRKYIEDFSSVEKIAEQLRHCTWGA